MSKKILIATGIMGGIIIASVFVYLSMGTGGENAENESIFSFLLPEGTETTGTPNSPETKQTKEQTASISTQIAQIANTPISGAAINNDTNKIRYVEKATGHIYEIGEDGKDKKAISATTIPKIFEVSYSYNTKGAILKYLEDDGVSARTFLAYDISTSTEGVFLPVNTIAAVASPSEEKIFYLMKNSETKGVVSSFENKNAKEIFSFPVGDFLVEWPGKNTITLLSKPTAFFGGYFYKLNAQTKSLEKILGNINGLTAKLSPSGELTIYSEYLDNSIVSRIYDAKKKQSLQLGISTLAEKCVFSKINSNIIYCAAPETLPDAYYPDDWHKGLISFSDGFWKIDAREGSMKFISSGRDADAINLFLNKNESKLFFTNKKDSTLWSLNL